MDACRTIFVDASITIMDSNVVDYEEIVGKGLISSNNDSALSAIKNQVVGYGNTGCHMPCLDTEGRDLIHNIIGDKSAQRGMVNALIQIAIGSQRRTDIIDNVTNHIIIMI